VQHGKKRELYLKEEPCFTGKKKKLEKTNWAKGGGRRVMEAKVKLQKLHLLEAGAATKRITAPWRIGVHQGRYKTEITRKGVF